MKCALILQTVTLEVLTDVLNSLRVSHGLYFFMCNNGADGIFWDSVVCQEQGVFAGAISPWNQIK